MPLETIWVCPTCRGALRHDADGTRLVCTGCGAAFGIFGGIPDMRVDRPAWIDIDQDREDAVRLERDFRTQSLEAMVRAVFAAQPGRSQQQIDMRTRQVLVSPSRLRTQLDGWLRDATTPAIVSLDVIEHVGDQSRYLAEIDRIAADGASLALATPNRFSLAAEPHVHVWGVGWLPTRFQARYVRAKSGRSYDFVRLLSVPGLARLLRRHTRFTGRFLVPQVPEDEIESMPGRRARLARLYNRVSASPLVRWPLLAIGPFFRYTGTAQAGHARRAAPAT